MGSDAMFKLTYDCTYESMAGALISPDCTRSKHDVTKMGNAGNFKHYPAFTKPSTNDLAHYFKAAVKDWAQINSPLKVDVIYRDDSMNSFANVRFSTD
ncbi:hypothetical protein OESDEN_14484 [Oesophagostomum dentatum]|uniref:Uncharacterized protein n=1 Tax=Oesophagostomum dentatum TaxID=61180 RepID=A0A0B1SPG7_OESDE|nr:hypothetical protein OESDEN_14484 [Oesophagostomum dentatum]